MMPGIRCFFLQMGSESSEPLRRYVWKQISWTAQNMCPATAQQREMQQEEKVYLGIVQPIQTGRMKHAVITSESAADLACRYRHF